MRIVAGTARGRRLVVPKGDATRPTTDRVREATFNALYSMGSIEGATFCDLFAGSGALGLEALSRGAAHVTFVERNREALSALRTNIETLEFAQEATIVATDSMRWLVTAPHYDVILADPPYDFEQWSEMLDMAKAQILVAEANSPIEPTQNWVNHRQRKYGSTVVTVLTDASVSSLAENETTAGN